MYKQGPVVSRKLRHEKARKFTAKNPTGIQIQRASGSEDGALIEFQHFATDSDERHGVEFPPAFNGHYVT